MTVHSTILLYRTLFGTLTLFDPIFWRYNEGKVKVLRWHFMNEGVRFLNYRFSVLPVMLNEK